MRFSSPVAGGFNRELILDELKIFREVAGGVLQVRLIFQILSSLVAVPEISIFEIIQNGAGYYNHLIGYISASCRTI